MQKLLAALKTDLSWVAQHTNLLRRANEWNAKGRDHGYLLRGSELQEAETWLSQAGDERQPRPTPLQNEYIYTSRQEDLRRQRRTLIGVSVALVVSILLAIAAVISGINALRQSQKALASELAARSISFVDTQPDLSLLLSLEANYIGDELGESDPASLGSLITALNSSPKLGTFLRAHESDVRAVAFSPDGRWLATAGGVPSGETGEVILWDLQSGANKPQKLETGTTNRFLAVAFSADSKTLVAAGDGKTLFVWNPEQCCTPTHTWTVTDKVRSIKFAKVNGQEYLIAATGAQATFWDVTTGKMNEALTLQAPIKNDEVVRILSLAVSPSNNELAAGSEDGSITLWDLRTGAMKFHVCSYGDVTADEITPCDADNNNDVKEIRGLAFNAYGTLLFAASSDQYGWLWNAQTGQPLAKTAGRNEGGHINTVTSVAFSPKTNQVATVSWDNTVRLWNVLYEAGSWSLERADTLAGHSNSIWATAYSPDGKWLASGSSDKSVILWKVNQINQIGVPIAQMEGDVWGLAVAPNGRQFAAGDGAGNIRIWNFDGQKISDPVTFTHTGGVLALAYSHDNKWLASAGYDNTIRVWDVQANKEAWHIENAHTDEIWALMFSPNDQLLASASYDKTAKLWNTSTHQLTGKPLEHADAIYALAFNEDGTQLLTAGWEAAFYLWDLTNTASVPKPSRLAKHIYSVNSLTYNPVYPPLLASTSDDKTLLIWNVDRKEPTPEVIGLNESMEAVTFSPNGTWLASATNNDTVLLWQLDSKRCAVEWDRNTCQPSRLGAPLVGHKAPVENVVFLSDIALISSSEDGQLIFWNLDKDFWYKHACTIVNRKFSPSESSQYTTGVNTTLLHAVDWFSSLFGSETHTTVPVCISE
jgi:WD40 repeat protein